MLATSSAEFGKFDAEENGNEPRWSGRPTSSPS